MEYIKPQPFLLKIASFLTHSTLYSSITLSTRPSRYLLDTTQYQIGRRFLTLNHAFSHIHSLYTTSRTCRTPSMRTSRERLVCCRQCLSGCRRRPDRPLLLLPIGHEGLRRMATKVGRQGRPGVRQPGGALRSRLRR